MPAKASKRPRSSGNINSTSQSHNSVETTDAFLSRWLTRGGVAAPIQQTPRQCPVADHLGRDRRGTSDDNDDVISVCSDDEADLLLFGVSPRAEADSSRPSAAPSTGATAARDTMSVPVPLPLWLQRAFGCRFPPQNRVEATTRARDSYGCFQGAGADCLSRWHSPLADWLLLPAEGAASARTDVCGTVQRPHAPNQAVSIGTALRGALFLKVAQVYLEPRRLGGPFDAPPSSVAVTNNRNNRSPADGVARPPARRGVAAAVLADHEEHGGGGDGGDNAGPEGRQNVTTADVSAMISEAAEAAVLRLHVGHSGQPNSPAFLIAQTGRALHSFSFPDLIEQASLARRRAEAAAREAPYPGDGAWTLPPGDDLALLCAGRHFYGCLRPFDDTPGARPHARLLAAPRVHVAPMLARIRPSWRSLDRLSRHSDFAAVEYALRAKTALVDGGGPVPAPPPHDDDRREPPLVLGPMSLQSIAAMSMTAGAFGDGAYAFCTKNDPAVTVCAPAASGGPFTVQPRQRLSRVHGPTVASVRAPDQTPSTDDDTELRRQSRADPVTVALSSDLVGRGVLCLLSGYTDGLIVVSDRRREWARGDVSDASLHVHKDQSGPSATGRPAGGGLTAIRQATHSENSTPPEYATAFDTCPSPCPARGADGHVAPVGPGHMVVAGTNRGTVVVMTFVAAASPPALNADGSADRGLLWDLVPIFSTSLFARGPAGPNTEGIVRRISFLKAVVPSPVHSGSVMALWSATAGDVLQCDTLFALTPTQAEQHLSTSSCGSSSDGCVQCVALTSRLRERWNGGDAPNKSRNAEHSRTTYAETLIRETGVGLCYVDGCVLWPHPEQNLLRVVLPAGPSVGGREPNSTTSEAPRCASYFANPLHRFRRGRDDAPTTDRRSDTPSSPWVEATCSGAGHPQRIVGVANTPAGPTKMAPAAAKSTFINSSDDEDEPWPLLNTGMPTRGANAGDSDDDDDTREAALLALAAASAHPPRPALQTSRRWGVPSLGGPLKNPLAVATPSAATGKDSGTLHVPRNTLQPVPAHTKSTPPLLVKNTVDHSQPPKAIQSVAPDNGGCCFEILWPSSAISHAAGVAGLTFASKLLSCAFSPDHQAVAIGCADGSIHLMRLTDL